MSSITKRRVRWVVAPLLAAASIAVASPAFATTFIGQNQPTVVQAVQGSTATLDWTYKNTGGSGTLPPSGGTMTFNAPAGTTFPAQSTVPTSYSSDGTTFGANNATLTGCTVGGGGTTLSCNITSANGGNSGWPANGYFRFSPTVAVSPTATPGTFSAAASMQFTDPNPSGNNYTITNGTLDVNIVQSASTPMVDPLVGLSAGVLVVGTGAAVVLKRRRRAGDGV
ncbi:hypothetical protein ABH924_004928 [Arthrobacter sp. GAS37]|uniref:hypothetical protein n=1 Tax=Arthrobacter sp. GAS37 TaxID=3156261 RepID=UPI003837F237